MGRGLRREGGEKDVWRRMVGIGREEGRTSRKGEGNSVFKGKVESSLKDLK